MSSRVKDTEKGSETTNHSPKLPITRPKNVSDKQWSDTVNLYNTAVKQGDKFPELTVAQAILETGWFKSPAGQYNYFGQKATSSQKGSVKNTKEVSQGQTYSTKSKFRDYSTLEEAVQDRVNKWGTKYQNAETVGDALYSIWKYDAEKGSGVGYATDPKYDQKIGNILGSMGVKFDSRASDYQAPSTNISQTSSTYQTPSEFNVVQGAEKPMDTFEQFQKDLKKEAEKEKKVEESTARKDIEEKKSKEQDFLQAFKMASSPLQEPQQQSQQQFKPVQQTQPELHIQTSLPQMPSIFTMADGGTVEDPPKKRPIIFVDPIDPFGVKAVKAYQDSLYNWNGAAALYRSDKNAHNVKEDIKDGRFSPTTFGKPGSPSFDDYQKFLPKTSSTVSFKKPIQPVEYKKEELLKLPTKHLDNVSIDREIIPSLTHTNDKPYEPIKTANRIQTIMEVDPKNIGKFKIKELRQVPYAAYFSEEGWENMETPRVLYYNSETGEETEKRFQDGGLFSLEHGEPFKNTQFEYGGLFTDPPNKQQQYKATMDWLNANPYIVKGKPFTTEGLAQRKITEGQMPRITSDRLEIPGINTYQQGEYTPVIMPPDYQGLPIYNINGKYVVTDKDFNKEYLNFYEDKKLLRKDEIFPVYGKGTPYTPQI